MQKKAYVFLGKEYEFLKEGFGVYCSDSPILYIASLEDVLGKVDRWSNKIISRFRRKLSIFRYLERETVFKRLYSSFPSETKYLFVSTDWFSIMERGFSDIYRKKNQNVKIIAYFTDNATKYTWLNIDDLWWSDWTITYNPKDVEERGWGFFMGINHKIFSDLPRSGIERKYDIFYCGAAKQRLDSLHHCYEYFVNMGLKCEFYITDVPEHLQMKSSRIKYNQPLSYREVQKKSAETRCILEISDANANGFTYRAEEAMMYRTKIITNVDFIKHMDFYNTDWVFCFSDIEEVSKQWVTDDVDIQYSYDDCFSVREMIKLVENHFCQTPVYPCTKWQQRSDEYVANLCKISHP